MHVREGLIPTVVGTAVTATGYSLRKTRPIVGYGIMGFGLAHMFLGAIDLVEHKRW